MVKKLFKYFAVLVPVTLLAIVIIIGSAAAGTVSAFVDVNKTSSTKTNNNESELVPEGSNDTSIKINIKSKHYTSESAYAQNGYWGQCTWFVNGRASEKLGVKLPANLGHGGQYYAGAKARGYKTGKTIRANSIISMSGGMYGHVAFIEKIEGNKVWITESNIEGLGVLTSKVHSLNSLKNGNMYGMNINGYVYL